MNIHVPFFIAAAAAAARILILTTVRTMLPDAERVQAEQVSAGAHGTAAAKEETAEGIVPVLSGSAGYTGSKPDRVILAPVDDSPIASRVTEAAARLASQARPGGACRARSGGCGGR